MDEGIGASDDEDDGGGVYDDDGDDGAGVEVEVVRTAERDDDLQYG